MNQPFYSWNGYNGQTGRILMWNDDQIFDFQLAGKVKRKYLLMNNFNMIKLKMFMYSFQKNIHCNC